MEEPQPPSVPPGGERTALGDHWDPSNPRDVAMIHRFAKEQPRAFAAVAAESEGIAAEMMRLSAQCAREAKAAALAPEDVTDAGKLAAISGRLALDIRKVKLADDHHAETMAAPKAGTTVNVGVQVNTMTDADRIRIATEAGVLHLLPAELAEKAREQA